MAHSTVVHQSKKRGTLAIIATALAAIALALFAGTQPALAQEATSSPPCSNLTYTGEANNPSTVTLWCDENEHKLVIDTSEMIDQDTYQVTGVRGGDHYVHAVTRVNHDDGTSEWRVWHDDTILVETTVTPTATSKLYQSRVTMRNFVNSTASKAMGY